MTRIKFWVFIFGVFVLGISSAQQTLTLDNAIERLSKHHFTSAGVLSQAEVDQLIKLLGTRNNYTSEENVTKMCRFEPNVSIALKNSEDMSLTILIDQNCQIITMHFWKNVTFTCGYEPGAYILDRFINDLLEKPRDSSKYTTLSQLISFEELLSKDVTSWNNKEKLDESDAKLIVETVTTHRFYNDRTKMCDGLFDQGIVIKTSSQKDLIVRVGRDCDQVLFQFENQTFVFDDHDMVNFLIEYAN
ncbi:MAG: hypothetical protein KDD48_03550 [Bdellovibrionales bacterium]|nr:hypothetical protein [Bdellovibrionales bacterium]